MSGNQDVLVFFVVGALSFAVVGARFLSAKAAPYRNFAIGLFAFAAAFLIWGSVAAARPADLGTYMSIGVVPFVAGFFALVSAATYDWTKRNRQLTIGITAAYLLVLFVLRTWTFPSTPGFSERGLMYFNAQPLVLLMYVLAFAGAFMTALQVVTRQISNRLQAALTRIFFNLVVLCGVVLLVSRDDDLQYLNGWLMLAAFVALLVVYVPGSSKAKLTK